MELVDEYPSLGMFSSSSEVSLVELLDSCSSIEPSTPAGTAATNSLLTSTPNTNKPSTQSSSNSIQLSQPIVHSPASTPTSSTSSLCSKRKALFSQEDSGRSSSATAEKTRLPDHLPFPDRFSITVEQAISANQVLSVRRQLISDLGAFYFALSKHPLQGDYKRMALLICNKFPDLRDSNPSSYWVCFIILSPSRFKLIIKKEITHQLIQSMYPQFGRKGCCHVLIYIYIQLLGLTCRCMLRLVEVHSRDERVSSTILFKKLSFYGI